MKVLILDGPNLNLLGEREPEIYGLMTPKDIKAALRDIFPELNLDFFQSNHEGVMIDKMHAARKSHDGVVLNAAAFTHYSYALRDAIAAIDLPVVEVHLSNPDEREDFRKVNVIRDVCAAHFQGEGIDSYKKALDYFSNLTGYDW